jgi:hypothetical protein
MIECKQCEFVECYQVDHLPLFRTIMKSTRAQITFTGDNIKHCYFNQLKNESNRDQLHSRGQGPNLA